MANPMGRRAFVLTVVAVGWAAALFPVAFFAPLYGGESVSRGASGSNSGVKVMSTTSTLVEQNGLWVVVLVSLPVLAAVLAWFGLHLRCSRGSGLGTLIAWATVGVLAAFSLVAAFSIGPLILPVVLLLAVAAACTPVGRQPVG